jgi:tetratricopeptide (TPR) repeat protein
MKRDACGRRWTWTAAALAFIAGCGMAAPSRPVAAQAQPTAVSRAVDLEQAGRWADAIVAWRRVLAAGDVEQGALGLERVYAQLGREDTVRALVDSLLASRPGNRVLRGIQLRTLRSLGRTDDESAAFEAWVASAPDDASPYKEYANQLLMDGRAARADTVLQRGVRKLGASGFQLELAQLYVALGQWGRGAAAWREIVAAEPYMDQSALFSMGAVPASERDSVRAALAAPPMSVGARKVLGQLELQWLNAREGWRVLSALTAADSAYDTWADFASGAERQGAWIPARDALLRMSSVKPQLSVLLRAAAAAVSGGEPATALPVLADARRRADAAALRTQVLPLEIRALTALGRAAEAEALVQRDGASADAVTRQVYARQIAWGWVRAGEVEKARAALAGASADDDQEVSGWIALFEGDLVRARAGLRRPADATPDVVTAMALLGRTRADTSVMAGAAFLALARGDTATAAQRLERAAVELDDAAPLLLAFAARLWSQRKADATAISLWSRIVQQYPQSPEAAESDLEWARTLRRRGDAAGARERLEHLIISYPQSALVPQARRELEALRGGVA